MQLPPGVLLLVAAAGTVQLLQLACAAAGTVQLLQLACTAVGTAAGAAELGTVEVPHLVVQVAPVACVVQAAQLPWLPTLVGAATVLLLVVGTVQLLPFLLVVGTVLLFVLAGTAQLLPLVFVARSVQLPVGGVQLGGVAAGTQLAGPGVGPLASVDATAAGMLLSAVAAETGSGEAGLLWIVQVPELECALRPSPGRRLLHLIALSPPGIPEVATHIAAFPSSPPIGHGSTPTPPYDPAAFCLDCHPCWNLEW